MTKGVQPFAQGISDRRARAVDHVKTGAGKMAASEVHNTPSLSWECDVPLLTHPAILGSLVKVWTISGFLMFALVGGIIGWQDGIKAVIPLAEILLVVLAGLLVLSLLVMLVVFGNRMRMGFVIDDHGVMASLIDRRAKTASRLAAGVGALAGKPGVAGAGLIAMSDEERSAVWSGIASAKYDARRHTVALRNNWRTVLYVFCTPENYGDAAARIAANVARAARPAQARRNPLWGALGLTVLVVLAVLPLFAMPYPFEPHLLAVIFTFCFALATVWLVPLMAWAVLAGVASIVVTIVLRGVEPKINHFTGSPYTSFGSMDAADVAGFAVVAAGLLVLVFISVAALRGRISSLLTREMNEMAGGKQD